MQGVVTGCLTADACNVAFRSLANTVVGRGRGEMTLRVLQPIDHRRRGEPALAVFVDDAGHGVGHRLNLGHGRGCLGVRGGEVLVLGEECELAGIVFAIGLKDRAPVGTGGIGFGGRVEHQAVDAHLRIVHSRRIAGIGPELGHESVDHAHLLTKAELPHGALRIGDLAGAVAGAHGLLRQSRAMRQFFAGFGVEGLDRLARAGRHLLVAQRSIASALQCALFGEACRILERTGQLGRSFCVPTRLGADPNGSGFQRFGLGFGVEAGRHAQRRAGGSSHGIVDALRDAGFVQDVIPALLEII